jgi:hypothetical protein
MSDLSMDYDLACLQEQFLRNSIPEFDSFTDRAILDFFTLENISLGSILWDVSCTAFMIETKVHCSWNKKSERMSRNMFFDLADCFLAVRAPTE